MSVTRVQQKSYQLEDRVMEGYAVAYRAYCAPRPAWARADLRGLCRNPQVAREDGKLLTVCRSFGEGWIETCLWRTGLLSGAISVSTCTRTLLPSPLSPPVRADS
jgi:hypothetical protein